MQSETVIFTIAKSRQGPTLEHRSQKSHLMSSPPTGDEGMHIIERKPQPRLLQSAVTNAELQSAPGPTDQGSGLSSARRIALIGGIILLFLLLAGGVTYWIRAERYPVVVTIGVPDRGASQDPLGKRAGPLVPVNPEMLHVSSIALGNPRLTIVNGKRLAEGDWLIVSTPVGAASVRCVQIEDGIVRFRHGGETLSAKLHIVEKPGR